MDLPVKYAIGLLVCLPAAACFAIGVLMGLESGGIAIAAFSGSWIGTAIWAVRAGAVQHIYRRACLAFSAAAFFLPVGALLAWTTQGELQNPVIPQSFAFLIALAVGGALGFAGLTLARLSVGRKATRIWEAPKGELDAAQSDPTRGGRS